MISHAFRALFELVAYACPPWISLGLVTLGLVTYGFFVEEFWIAVTLWSFACTTGFFASLAYRHR